MTKEVDEPEAITLVREGLISKFPDARPDLIHEIVVDALQEFSDARVRTFVPVLVHRAALDRIRLLLARVE